MEFKEFVLSRNLKNGAIRIAHAGDSILAMRPKGGGAEYIVWDIGGGETFNEQCFPGRDGAPGGPIDLENAVAELKRRNYART